MTQTLEPSAPAEAGMHPLVPGSDEAAAEFWRLQPDTFAERASGGRWVAWDYLRYLGRVVAEAVSGGDGRLIVNMPPGYGKSNFLSKWTPAWLLDLLPEWRVIMASHGMELASEWGRAVRNELEFNPLLTTRLREDSKAAHRWNTPQGGGMYATGVGGGITGFRANVMLIDDPHPTWEAVQSAVHRRRAAEWIEGTMLDRLEPGGTVVLLMHRWHEDDLTGHLVGHHGERWRVIRFPAVAEAGDLLGRAVGEPLCQQRWDADALRAKRVEVTDAVWFPKYQQRPLGVGAGRVYFRYLPEQNNDPGLRLRDELPLDVSFDFNFNPGMHVVLGQYDPAADLFTAVHEVHGPYMRLQDTPGVPGSGCLSTLVKLLGDLGRGGFPWPELRVFGDPAGHQNRAETTHTAWQQVLIRLEPYVRGLGKPLRMNVTAAQYPVKTRIDTFNAALCDDGGQVHYRVHPANCPRLAEDFKRLRTDEAGLIDKSDSRLSHSSEAEANRVCRVRPIRRVPVTPGRVGTTSAAGGAGAAPAVRVVGARTAPAPTGLTRRGGAASL